MPMSVKTNFRIPVQSRPVQRLVVQRLVTPLVLSVSLVTAHRYCTSSEQQNSLDGWLNSEHEDPQTVLRGHHLQFPTAPLLLKAMRNCFRICSGLCCF